MLPALPVLKESEVIFGESHKMNATYQVSRAERVVNATIKGLTIMLCRVKAEQLKRVPSRGPLIIVSNHINFLEVPIIYTRLQSDSPKTGFVKVETWENPFLGPLFSLWGAIPIRRGEAQPARMQE